MSWLLSALVGAATGVLSGFGVGGGTLLLLWLTLVQGMGQLQAGGVNLLYFAANKNSLTAYFAVKPPSTVTMLPVIKLLAGLNSEQITCATSSARPTRPIG